MSGLGTSSTSGCGSGDFSALNPQLFHQRAVENDYLEKIPISRPSSDPFIQPHPLYGAPRLHRDRMRMEGVRCSSLGESDVLRLGKRRVVPGSAKRVPPKVTTLPHTTGPLVQRELKPLSYSKYNCQRTLTTATQTPPPVPPPPSEAVAKRLGLLDQNCIPCEPEVIRNPVRTQPTSCHDDPHRKLLVADFEEEKGRVKSRCVLEAKVDPKKSPNPKPGRTRRLTSIDHVIIEHDDDKCRPGEHQYPCPRCGRCMCTHCKGQEKQSRSRELWCGGRCECSADAIVDAVTCFCIVRGCFYHCANSDEARPLKPCSCRDPNCCARWAAVAGLSLLLPCLLSYPFARGCMLACKQCNRCTRPGCRCKESNR